MKNQLFNRQSGSIRWIFAAGIAALLVLALVVAVQSSAGRAVRKKQAAFLVGIEKRNPARIRRLLSDDYEDRWGFGPGELVDAVTEAGGQFLVMTVTAEETGFVREGDEVRISQRLTVGGKPVGPAAQQVTRMVNKLDGSFVFTWKKESFLASSWRLVSADHPDLPDDLGRYRSNLRDLDL